MITPASLVETMARRVSIDWEYSSSVLGVTSRSAGSMTWFMSMVSSTTTLSWISVASMVSDKERKRLEVEARKELNLGTSETRSSVRRSGEKAG